MNRSCTCALAKSINQGDPIVSQLANLKTVFENNTNGKSMNWAKKRREKSWKNFANLKTRFANLQWQTQVMECVKNPFSANAPAHFTEWRIETTTSWRRRKKKKLFCAIVSRFLPAKSECSESSRCSRTPRTLTLAARSHWFANFSS